MERASLYRKRSFSSTENGGKDELGSREGVCVCVCVCVNGPVSGDQRGQIF